MKASFFASLSIVLFSSITLAAIPSKITAEEILIMPESFRKEALLNKAEEFYPQMHSIAFSNKQSIEMRWKALTAMALLKKENSVKDLKKALVAPEWYMRNAALLSLNSVSPKHGKKAAQELLTDKALVVRSAAVDVLGPMMDAEIRELFWQEMDANYNFRRKQSLWIREQLLGFLAQEPLINEKSVFEGLSKTSPEPMRVLAKNALQKIK